MSETPDRATESTLEPEWLRALRRDVAARTTEAAREFWPGRGAADPPRFNYRLEHILQVERDALRLASLVGADQEVVLASVWIHDRFQPQFADLGCPDHAAEGAAWAEDNLPALGFPPAKVPRVCSAVSHHRSAPGLLLAEPLETRVLWDADKLAHCGVVDLVHTLANRLAADAADLRRRPPVLEAPAVTTLALATAWLSEADASGAGTLAFYFEPSRVWATERLAARHAFYHALAREVGLR